MLSPVQTSIYWRLCFIYLFTGVNVYLEVSVELQLKHEQTLNLTLFGQSNLSSLHLLPPEKQEEEEVEEEVGNDRQLKAFYCCLSVRTQPRSANQSRCLLLLSNQTVSNATAKEEASWERTVKGWCSDQKDVFFCSLCGHSGVTWRLEGLEGIQKLANHFSFVMKLIQSHPNSSLFYQTKVESFFSIEQICLNFPSLDSSLGFVTLPPPPRVVWSETSS